MGGSNLLRARCNRLKILVKICGLIVLLRGFKVGDVDRRRDPQAGDIGCFAFYK